MQIADDAALTAMHLPAAQELMKLIRIYNALEFKNVGVDSSAI